MNEKKIIKLSVTSGVKLGTVYHHLLYSLSRGKFINGKFVKPMILSYLLLPAKYAMYYMSGLTDYGIQIGVKTVRVDYDVNTPCGYEDVEEVGNYKFDVKEFIDLPNRKEVPSSIRDFVSSFSLGVGFRKIPTSTYPPDELIQVNRYFKSLRERR